MTTKRNLGPPHGPHGFPAYVVMCRGFEQDPPVVHARSRNRAKAICIRSMVEADYARNWRDAFDRIVSVVRSPGDDGNEVGHRIAPGEGFTLRRMCLG